MIENLRKRLLYKATHRGMKETDRIIGQFAEKEINNLSSELLLQFDRFLDQPDADILNWLLYKANIPDEYNNDVFRLILKFKEEI